MSRGLFVALEGGEGAGKTTLARALAEHFTEQGIEVVLTREPGGTDLGTQLRGMLLHTPDLDPATQVLLFAADRAHHVATLIRPALERGAMVICDRFVDSSIAYQSAAGVDIDDIVTASRIATGGLTPDLTILLDVDESTRRARRGEGSDVFERQGEDFHERIRDTFLRQALSDTTCDSYRVFPTDYPFEAITRRCIEEIDLRAGAPA